MINTRHNATTKQGLCAHCSLTIRVNQSSFTCEVCLQRICGNCHTAMTSRNNNNNASAVVDGKCPKEPSCAHCGNQKYMTNHYKTNNKVPIVSCSHCQQAICHRCEAKLTLLHDRHDRHIRRRHNSSQQQLEQEEDPEEEEDDHQQDLYNRDRRVICPNVSCSHCRHKNEKKTQQQQLQQQQQMSIKVNRLKRN